MPPWISAGSCAKLRSHGFEAGSEDVVTDLRDDGVAICVDHFKIRPPFRERAIALGDAVQPDSGHVAPNRQRAFDNFVGKSVILVVQAEQNLAHETLRQSQTAHASYLVA